MLVHFIGMTCKSSVGIPKYIVGVFYNLWELLFNIESYFALNLVYIDWNEFSCRII